MQEPNLLNQNDYHLVEKVRILWQSRAESTENVSNHETQIQPVEVLRFVAS